MAIDNNRIALAYISDGLMKRCVFRSLPDGMHDEAALDALKAMVNENALKGTACTLVLQPSEYQLILAETPPVESQEISTALPWRIKDLLHAPLEELAIDHFLLPEDAYRGRQHMLYAVAVAKNDLARWADLAEAAQLKLDSIDIMELAVQNLLGEKRTEGSNVAILYLGSGRGFITVSYGHEIYLSRNVEISLEKILSTLPEDDTQFSGGTHLDTLLLELQRSLDYYESQLSKGGVADLYVVPLGEHHQRIVDFLDRNLAARVHGLDLGEQLESEELLDTETQHACFAATAASLWESSSEA